MLESAYSSPQFSPSAPEGASSSISARNLNATAADTPLGGTKGSVPQYLASTIRRGECLGQHMMV